MAPSMFWRVRGGEPFRMVDGANTVARGFVGGSVDLRDVPYL